jgi:DNA invertase Pin-like site-specific DNA recombinase
LEVATAMLVGFVRRSEFEKQADLDAQRRALTAAGVEKVFSSGVTLKEPRARLDVAAALSFMREGDCLVVTRPDRIARTPADLLKICDGLTKRGCGFVLLSGFGPRLDTRDKSSEQVLTALRAVAAWDLAYKKERRRAGIERTRIAEPEKYVRAGFRKVPPGAALALARDGFGPTKIARILKIHRDTVRVYLGPDYKAPRKPKREPRAPLDARVIQTLLAAGVGPTRVALAIGCSKSSVRRLSRVQPS